MEIWSYNMETSRIIQFKSGQKWESVPKCLIVLTIENILVAFLVRISIFSRFLSEDNALWVSFCGYKTDVAADMHT